MSLKYAVTKVSDNHYVLPKVGTMKVEVHAFLSENLFCDSDEQTWKQAMVAASFEGVTGAYLMPDTSPGHTVPLGCVLVTDDVLIQACSGFDIACGVIYLRAHLTAASVKSKYQRERWIKAVEDRIATGRGHQRPKNAKTFNKSTTEEILRHGAKAIGVGVDDCERQYIPIDPGINLKKDNERAYAKALGQLGSVGGGNHFIEMQVDRDSGEVFVMVHCGSRGYGRDTAEHFFSVGAAHRGIHSGRRESSWLRLSEEIGRKYWNFHNSAANFATVNRYVIVDGIREATQDIFGADVETYYEISHNLIQEETLVLPDGTTKKGLVHRKGATRAFPAGHPDLAGTRWEKTGHPCLIPGSMFDGAAILFPSAGAYMAGCSVNHGSGRTMARGQAKRKLEHKQLFIDEEMSKVQRTFAGIPIEGVVTNHNHIPIDECRYVYKDLDAVLAVLEDENIARVTHRLYPVANLKGTD
jgi:tRNA-splicing ligase RtcB (3'-phosphate/5'-hydroxy nucleic acid ligase)